MYVCKYVYMNICIYTRMYTYLNDGVQSRAQLSWNTTRVNLRTYQFIRRENMGTRFGCLYVWASDDTHIRLSHITGKKKGGKKPQSTLGTCVICIIWIVWSESLHMYDSVKSQEIRQENLSGHTRLRFDLKNTLQMWAHARFSCITENWKTKN